MNPPDNIIDEIGGVIGSLFVRYGWYVVFLGILLYALSPHASRIVDNLNRAHANRASRRKILDENRKRARMVQQLDVYKANRMYKMEEGT